MPRFTGIAPGSESDLNRRMVDAIREILGLSPLYEAEPPRQYPLCGIYVLDADLRDDISLPIKRSFGTLVSKRRK